MEESCKKKAQKVGWVTVFMICPLLAMGQTPLFFDDFSGNLSKWKELGNAGTPVIADGMLHLQWGFAPNWFVTNDTFNFGVDPLRFDFTFVEGGFQATANYKQNYVQPLLGANDPNQGTNGAVRARFSADYFELERRSVDAAGALAWVNIPFTDDPVTLSVTPGSRVRFEIDETAQRGELFVNGQRMLMFLTQPVMEGGVGFRVVTTSRNVIVDDVYFAQIDAGGNETLILRDDFNRAELGDDWVNENLAADPSPGPLDAFIENGQLNLTNDGSGDSWLRTNAQVDFVGKTTIFEYTFVNYYPGLSYRPTVVLGVKPYQSGVTSGVILIDNGSGINYGMVNGGWAQGQASRLGGSRNGMRFKIVFDPGGQSGTVYRDDVRGLRFFNLGPTFSGGFAFRTIVDRDAVIDDIRVYTMNADGSETTIFEDNFNRAEVGNDWVTESITPDVAPGAQWSSLEDRDSDGDNELFLDHDSSLDDAWFRLKKDLPYSGDKPVVVEGTYVSYNAYASMAIGTSEWIKNQIVGPILLDNLETPWVMDTRGGNVWVRPGPIGGSKISLQVNADGRSGSFLVNDVAIRNWQFAAGELAIPVGAVGFEDPYTSPQLNTSPPAAPNTYATVVYDDISVSRTQDTAVSDWMIH
jgi:hypothetical protein